MLMPSSYSIRPSESAGHGFKGWDSPDRQKYHLLLGVGWGRDYDTSAVVFPNESIGFLI